MNSTFSRAVRFGIRLYAWKMNPTYFLRNMVRAVVGTLLEIGRGKHGPDWMQEVMLSASRSAAGESVPGHALFFCGASYPEG